MNHLPKVCVIGGMNLDILAVPSDSIIMRDSNIGHITMRPGGVGRNIASKLAGAGCEVGFLTVLGTGQMADLLCSACNAEGINLSLSVKTECPPSVYLAVHDDSGDMLVAVNDMESMNYLTAEVIREKAEVIDSYDMCIVDANLSESVLKSVIEYVHIPVVADPVSTLKAKRCIPILHGLYAIKPNLIEAQAMTGETDAKSCAECLRKMGVRNVYISMGKNGVYYHGDYENGHIPAENVVLSPQTGAGDAMLAGLIIAMHQRKKTSECAEYGQKAALEYLRKNEKN